MIAAETERLRLRTWRDGDSDRFYAALNTPAVMRYLGGVQTREVWEVGVERIQGYQRDFGHTLYILEHKDSGELIGFCGLKRVNAPGAGDLTGSAEVGWRLRESAWGQGIAKEAAIAALDLAFDTFAYQEVVALTVAGNHGSWGLMKRLGMTRRSDLDYEDPRFGPELNPTIVYAITAGEWPAARAAALA